MEIKSAILNNIVFLDEILLLRQQKGKYLCTDFCAQLEKLSDKIIKTIFLDFGFKRTISNQLQCSENSKKIANNLVDLCLKCIEMDLREIQSSSYALQTPLDIEVLPILIDISEDLLYLIAHIKFTVSSGDLMLRKQANNSVENFSQ